MEAAAGWVAAPHVGRGTGPAMPLQSPWYFPFGLGSSAYLDGPEQVALHLGAPLSATFVHCAWKGLLLSPPSLPTQLQMSTCPKQLPEPRHSLLFSSGRRKKVNGGSVAALQEGWWVPGLCGPPALLKHHHHLLSSFSHRKTTGGESGGDGPFHMQCTEAAGKGVPR